MLSYLGEQQKLKEKKSVKKLNLINRNDPCDRSSSQNTTVQFSI